MDGELAVPGEQHRRDVLDADARPAGDDHDVRLGVECLENRVVLIGNEAREVDDAPVAFDEGGQHGTVRVGDAHARRR